MKKYIFMAVAGMLALSSCSNDDNDVQNTQNAPRQMTFTAGFGDGGLTRASLSGKSVSFDTNDAFSILSANNTTAVQFTTTDGTNFSGTAADAPEFYAVYPHKAGYTYDGSLGTISGVIIPTNQTITSTRDWDPSAPIAYATTTGTSLLFRNACALLKITNDRGEAAVIEVGCNEALTGTFSLNTSNGTLSGTAPKGHAYVEGVPANKTIYIAIAPGTKTGFTADWVGVGSSGFAVKQKSSAVTFEAGKIYNLGKTSEW